MKITHQKEIEVVNNCEAIFDEEELKAAMLWYADKPIARKKNVYMHGMYPCVSIYFQKIHIHRLLMNYWTQGDISSEMYVHHKNHDRRDARRENLELMDASKHQSLHNKGKKLSREHREAISEANKGRKGMRLRRKYNFSNEEMMKIFNAEISKNQLSIEYGCDWETVDRHYKEFLFENPELLTEES